jgi:hypothetical protein
MRAGFLVNTDRFADRVLRGGWLHKSAARRPPLGAATSLASTANLHWIPSFRFVFRRVDRSSRECGLMTAWSVHRTALVRPVTPILICPEQKSKKNFCPLVAQAASLRSTGCQPVKKHPTGRFAYRLAGLTGLNSHEFSYVLVAPGRTTMALSGVVGQAIWQAPQPLQRSRSTCGTLVYSTSQNS